MSCLRCDANGGDLDYQKMELNEVSVGMMDSVDGLRFIIDPNRLVHRYLLSIIDVMTARAKCQRDDFVEGNIKRKMDRNPVPFHARWLGGWSVGMQYANGQLGKPFRNQPGGEPREVTGAKWWVFLMGWFMEVA